MSITKFINSHTISSREMTAWQNKGLVSVLRSDETDFIFENYGGVSFDNGALRVHNRHSAAFWQQIITEFFSAYKDKIIPFAFDWMGRQFAVNVSNPSEFLINMFDHATGEAFDLPKKLELFFNEELVDFVNDTLSMDIFTEILKNNSQEELPFNKIFSYKTPLFLGGKDDLSNYEIADIEVNWEINRQLLLKIKG